ncbi:MAG: exodeoxyribonuclease III [Chromatiales bacterium]
MRVATWNVNSLRARLSHVLGWLQLARPDIVALQETKIPDDEFPTGELCAAGYYPVCNGQRTYNGVAILTRTPGEVIAKALPDREDPQRRLLTMRFGTLHVINVYVPNGAAVGTDKYTYKLAWLRGLRAHVQELLAHGQPVLLLGDFNIAPDDRDVRDPKAWEGQVLVSEPEREQLRALQTLGLHDCFRLFEQPVDVYSWWDYRAGAFRRNMGLRIDLILVDARLARRCTACRVDAAPRKWERPSDHAPVIAEFDLVIR